MNKMRWLNRLMAAASLVLVAGCGGGGGGSSLYGGNGPPPAPTAASISLDLGGVTSITNSGTDTVTATVTAKDANNVVVAGVPVTMRADTGEVVLGAAVTDSTGKVTARISIGPNKANRTILVTATSGSLTQTRSFLVTGARIKSTLVPSVLSLGSNGQIQYQVLDVNGNGIVGQSIQLTSSLGTTTALTDSSGSYTYNYTAPLVSGDVSVTANSAGATPVVDTVTVQSASGGSKPVVTAGSILSAFVEANPSVVKINEPGQLGNRAAVRALFSGANNASIANVRVRFDLNGDPNSVGGSMSSGSSILYSDANGEVSAFYIPASKASPTNGVSVRACYGYSDAELASNACPNQALVTLTVASGAVSITIGTNGTLIELNNGLQLAQDFVVTVNDSAGRAQSGVDIIPSVDLLAFSKGSWSRPLGATGWSPTIYQSFVDLLGNYIDFDSNSQGACLNEDRNRNGIKEVLEDSPTAAYSATQGGNGNGALDPPKADLLITVNGAVSAKTDSTGSAVVRITYARSTAGWLKYKILVSAGGISGTEGRASKVGILKVPVDDVNGDATPAFAVSPYGSQPGCQNPN